MITKNRPTQKTIATLLVIPLVAATAITTTAVAALAMRPTLAEFVTAADAICHRADGQIASLKIGGTMPAIRTFATSLGTTTTKTAAKLRTLPQPPDAKVDTVIDQMALAGSRATALAEAAHKSDYAAAAKAADQTASSFARADDLSRQIGMRECGRSASRVAAAGAQGAPHVFKRAYIGRANAKCLAVLAKLGPEPETLPEMNLYMGEVVAIGTKLNAELRAIVPPPSERAAVAGVYKSFDGVVASAKSLRSAIVTVLLAATQADLEEEAAARHIANLESGLVKFVETTVAANAKADQYGMKDCGSGDLDLAA